VTIKLHGFSIQTQAEPIGTFQLSSLTLRRNLLDVLLFKTEPSSNFANHQLISKFLAIKKN